MFDITATHSFTFYRVDRETWDSCMDNTMQLQGFRMRSVSSYRYLMSSSGRALCTCHKGDISCRIHGEDYGPEGDEYLIAVPNDVFTSKIYASSVGESNYLVLRSYWDSGSSGLMRVYWDDSASYAFRVDGPLSDEVSDMLEGLDDYPLLDEELHSQVEQEWIDESIRGYYLDTLREDIGSKLNIDLDDINDDALFVALNEAMDELGIRFELDGSDAYMTNDDWQLVVAQVVRGVQAPMHD